MKDLIKASEETNAKKLKLTCKIDTIQTKTINDLHHLPPIVAEQQQNPRQQKQFRVVTLLFVKTKNVGLLLGDGGLRAPYNTYRGASSQLAHLNQTTKNGKPYTSKLFVSVLYVRRSGG